MRAGSFHIHRTITQSLQHHNCITSRCIHSFDLPFSHSLLQSLRNATSPRHGMLFHHVVIEQELDHVLSFQISALQMYSQCRSSEDATALFDRMLCRDATAWTYIIRAHSQSTDVAFKCLHQLQLEGVLLPKFLSISILSACSEQNALEAARRMHTIIASSRLDDDTFVATSILSMYSRCGSIADAVSTFIRIQNRDVVAWNAMLSAYVDSGWHTNAFQHFEEMQRLNVPLNKVTFLSILEACSGLASLDEGKRIHGLVLARDLHKDISVGNAIINMYSKCGSIGDARLVFEHMMEHNTISWNTLIAAYTQAGEHNEALLLFDQMQSKRIPMDKVTVVTLLSACTDSTALPQVRKLYHYVLCGGFDSDPVVGTAVINAYGKGNSVSEARNVFDGMESHDIICQNAMISVYGQHGLCDAALYLFNRMLSNRVNPDKATFVIIFNACANHENLSAGQWIHGRIQGTDIERDVMVGTAIIRLYANCGTLEAAEEMFDKLSDRDIILWNTMITGYVLHGENNIAVSLYHQMMAEGIISNRITFTGLLNACANECLLDQGKQMHARFAYSVIEDDVVVVSALVNMYGKCGCVDSAFYFFDRIQERDLVAWTTMISIYGQYEQPQKAFLLFQRMKEEGLIPDIVAAIGVISACASYDVLYISKQIHACILDPFYCLDAVLGNTLINMYGKCSNLKDAILSFEQMHNRDAISFLNAISTCANYAALIEGQKVHTCLVASGLDCDKAASNALLNLYGKCGMFDDAWKLFEDTSQCNIVAWNTMITTCALNGNGKNALQLFSRMLENQVKPDSFTFVSILTACSHAGLILEGYCTFLCITLYSGFSPIIDHYNCLLDMLARAGQLDNAENLIRMISRQATAVSWTSLLSGCKTEVDVQRGECAAVSALKRDPGDVGLHVLLANIYAAANAAMSEDDFWL